MNMKARHWELALNDIEEWRLARAEFREQYGESSASSDDEAARSGGVDRPRFRRWQPAKAPVDPHDLVFVNQSALDFGSDTGARLARRRLLVLRMDEASGDLLGAPIWSGESNLVPQRLFPISEDTAGIHWHAGATPFQGHVYDSVEYVARTDLRLNDPDWQIARFQEPLIGKVLAFVFMPANATRS